MIEALQPLHIRRAAGDLHLLPGYPVELPDDEASKLLSKAGGKVRAIPEESLTVDPAMRPDGSPLSSIYWETWDGRILGPALPEYLARDRNIFWIVVTFSEQTRWINADRLRSKKAFDAQFPHRLNRKESMGRR